MAERKSLIGATDGKAPVEGGSFSVESPGPAQPDPAAKTASCRRIGAKKVRATEERADAGKVKARAGRDHDGLYHRIFSDPRMVTDLLRGFVDQTLLDGLDLEDMERLNAKYHFENGVRREGDTVWRIPQKDGGDIYLVLLLEFQSSPDRWMALRMMVYTGMLWQNLVRERRLLPGEMLPAILPIVLYNGRPRWADPLSLRELVRLPDGSPLWRWQPDGTYHIIDQGAIPIDKLKELDLASSLLFRIERASNPTEALTVVEDVLSWFNRNPGYEAIRKVYLQLIRSSLKAVDLNGTMRRIEEGAMQSNLAVSAERWKEGWLKQGRREGRREGRQEGRQEGRASMVSTLTRLLQRRFGFLPDWAKERIATGDSAALEEWILRVLDAERLEDVLG